MSLQKITFDGASVTSKLDADINHHLGGLVPAGVLAGVGNECKVSVANNYISFQDGYVQIYGRRLFVEDGSEVYISLDSTKYGYVIIDVNLTNNSAVLKTLESSSTYPSLITTDLVNGGMRYQFALAKYKKTTSSITLASDFKPTYIKPGLRKVNKVLKTKAKYFEDSAGNSSQSITFDTSDIPYNSMVHIVFLSVDLYSFGGFNQICGSLSIPNSSMYWSYGYVAVRNTINYGNNGEVLIGISSTDFDEVTFTKATNDTGYPNAVYLCYEVLEEE